MDFDQQSPIYQQLAEKIRQAILNGDLGEQKAIPSVRQITVEYGLNPQTVLNATALLIQEKLIEKRRGLGYFVLPGARSRLLKANLKQFRDEKVAQFVAHAKTLGISRDELLSLIDDIYGDK